MKRPKQPFFYLGIRNGQIVRIDAECTPITVRSFSRAFNQNLVKLDSMFSKQYDDGVFATAMMRNTGYNERAERILFQDLFKQHCAAKP